MAQTLPSNPFRPGLAKLRLLRLRLTGCFFSSQASIYQEGFTLSFNPRSVPAGDRAVSAIGKSNVHSMESRAHRSSGKPRASSGNLLRLVSLATTLAVLPFAGAQTLALNTLPDAPVARESSPEPASDQSTTPQQTPPPPGTQTPPSDATTQPPAGSGVSPQLKGDKQLGEEQLKKEEQQRILGVMPAFNSVYEGTVPPLTPGQKFRLMFKSTTDVYVFAFAAVTAGIGQAQDSHAAYGQGIEGYAKRFGANYVDTADGNFWGNAVLPIVLHQDPRYFRLGHGTFKHRLLYSMSTAVICKSDSGKWEPNYSNVLGNLIAGGISNLYYPAQDRGAAQTFQSAATVTAEGMIGAALIEFWPDIAHHYHVKRQAKRDADAAAARSAQAANPSGLPPQ
jgi:hypothetical protein